MARSSGRECVLDGARKEYPRSEGGEQCSGTGERKKIMVNDGDKVEDGGGAMLPCADMTCPCRVLKKR